jgi:hypothetical protein
VYASQIDINYRVNQNDNYLVKTQGMLNLYQMDCDPEFIMKTGGLSNDVKTDTKLWRENIEKKRAENAQGEAAQTTTNAALEEQIGNNSQE